LLYLYFRFTGMHVSCYKTTFFPNVDDKLFSNSSYGSQWHVYFGILRLFATACQERKDKRWIFNWICCVWDIGYLNNSWSRFFVNLDIFY
jgi:hypothetical protein